MVFAGILGSCDEYPLRCSNLIYVPFGINLMYNPSLSPVVPLIAKVPTASLFEALETVKGNPYKEILAPDQLPKLAA